MKLLLNWVLLCAHHLLINGLEPENQSAIPCGHLNFKEMGESNDQFIECNLSGNTISEIFLPSESSESTDRFIHDAIDCMYNGNQYNGFGEDIKIRSKRQTQQTADTTTPIDAKLKRKLKLHFTEDFEPQYFAFYHWLYKSLDNGKIPVYRKIKESVMDVNFVPSPNGISSTPFPIPEKLEAVYEYILYEKNGLKPNVSFSYIRPSPDTDDFEYGSEELAMTQVPITPMRHEIRDKLQKHFTEATMKPEYETFYKWLYEKLDFGKIPLSNKYDQLVTDKNFRPKSRWPVTPFPVPFKYNAIFEYLWRQEYLKYKKDDSLDRRR